MNRVLITILLIGSLVFACLAAENITINSDCEDFLSTHFDDCEDALRKGARKTGVHRIKPKSAFRPLKLWCDMETEGGGWTVIQARFDGSVDFYRSWKEYRIGFGHVDSEHWLGNNFIHHLTENNDYELKIELTGYEVNELASAKYSPFRIGSEDEKYKLYVGQFTSEGVIVDQLSQHNGSMFTTKDNDNDLTPHNCAQKTMGGWWYSDCYSSNLNGVWMSKARSIATKGSTPNNFIGINWRAAFNNNNSVFYSLKSVELKVRKIPTNIEVGGI